MSVEQAERRAYTITKFSMHKDGYPHCRVVIDGVAVYCTEEHGSWMIPGENGTYKEILSPYKEELAKKARELRKAIAKREHERKVQAAIQEVKASRAMGYKDKRIEDALKKRWEFTTDELCSIMQQSIPTQTEDTTDGTNQD